MLETTAVVTAEHTLTIQLPPGISPGDCRVVVVLEIGKPSVLPRTEWKPRNTGLVDPTKTFCREDMIAEDGPAVSIELLRLLSTITSQGKQVHDANVIATMIAHGVPTCCP
jgi:hypothetical protein